MPKPSSSIVFAQLRGIGPQLLAVMQPALNSQQRQVWQLSSIKKTNPENSGFVFAFLLLF
jgi:hypothetical protein